MRTAVNEFMFAIGDGGNLWQFAILGFPVDLKHIHRKSPLIRLSVCTLSDIYRIVRNHLDSHAILLNRSDS